jgi:A/G-specific adenine glycosylase
MMIEKKAHDFIKLIKEWASDNLRVFPWRMTRDPFKILIAEVLLQRTRAEQVAPIYTNFIKKFPDSYSLSKATIPEIETELSSLGLKKRGKIIYDLANQLENKHNGRIPKNKIGLLQLPGVGNYIANSVLNNAYQIAVPTVDVNFARIIVRVFSLNSKPPLQKSKEIWNFAEWLISFTEDASREVNLAILDIGSTLCKSRKPVCNKCPLYVICNFSKDGFEQARTKKI